MGNDSEAETEPNHADDDEVWTEWGVRRTWGDAGSVAFFERDYRSARKAAKEWPGQLVCRVVTAGEWVSGATNSGETP